MKAVLVHTPGGPEALDYVDLPVPTVSRTSVLIRAECFGVGDPDVLIRKGVYRWMPPLPANPGNDVAGRIEAVGADVVGLEIGQKVLLNARDLATRGGCYAEFVVAPADAVHVLPDNVALEAAVCLGNYQVAWALLNDAPAQKTPPKSVLVVGPAGGVGSAIVQLARLAGMRVIGVVSTEEKANFARSIGADDVIYYRTENVITRTLELTEGRGVDLVLDHVGGNTFPLYLEVLNDWGTIVSYNAFTKLPEANLLEEMRKHVNKCPAVRCFSFHIYDGNREGRRAIMRTLIAHLAAGEITPSISTRFKLSEVRQAHILLEAGSVLGKIVMTV